MQNTYVVTQNGQQVEVEWYAHNVASNIDATGVVGTFDMPAAGLSYVSHSGDGVYNPGLAQWTVGTVYRLQKKKIKIKYQVDDISYLNFSIKQTLTLNEDQSVLSNDNRVVFIYKEGELPCNPDAFITPTLEVVADDMYEMVYIGQNDTVLCPCCTKRYNLVANTSVNVQVIEILPTGWAKIIRTNPRKDSSFNYTASCINCTDGNDYTSFATVTATIHRLFTDAREYEGFVTLYAFGSQGPTVYVNNNEIGTITWTRKSNGDYRATSAGLFTWNHTNVYVTPEYNSDFEIKASRVSDNWIDFTYRENGVVQDPDIDVNFGLLIRVKNPVIPLSPSVSVTVSPTPSITPSLSVSNSITPSVSGTKSTTPSITVSSTVTPSISTSTSVTPSITPSLSVSSSITTSTSNTPSLSLSNSITASISVSITPSISITPTVTPSITQSITVSNTVTRSVTPSTSV